MKTLPDARWSCGQCGACCRGFRFGPVEPAVVEGLKARDIARHWPPAQQGWLEEVDGPSGTAYYFRNRADGSCVFLQADNGCAIHARFGAEAKPGFCREFPYSSVQTATDVSVIVRGECAGLYHSFRDGTLVSAEAEAVLALPRAVPQRRHAPPLLALLPGMGVGPEDWEKLEPMILERMSGKTPENALVETRELLSRVMGRPLPRVPDLEEPLAYLLSRLGRQLTQLLVSPLLDWQKEALQEGIRQVTRAMSSPPAALDPEAAAYLNLLLRGFVLGRQFAAHGSLAEGFGRFVLDLCIVRRNGTGTMTAADVAAIHAPWLRVMDHAGVERMLRADGQALAALFLGVGRIEA